MDKQDIKKLMVTLTVLVLLFLLFSLVFGQENIIVSIIVLVTSAMTLNSDFSVSPRISLIKIISVFWACAIVGYLNAPNNWLGLILGFVLIFMITFSSFRVLTTDTYIPYVMSYLLLLCKPVTLNELPYRLLALVLGAVLVVVLNVYVHKSNKHNSKEELVDSICDDLINMIDARINRKEYESIIPELNNHLNTTLFENLGYKYINNYKRESLTTLCKSAQYVVELVDEKDLSYEELDILKTAVLSIKDNRKFEKISDDSSKDFSAAMLNLEIIYSEKNRDINVENNYDFENVKSFVKSNLSFSSFKFSFALKLAFLISFWELLGLVFNLPYVKWLYFTSLVALVPYTDDVKRTSKRRIKATMGGVILFMVLNVILFSDYSVFNLLGVNVSSSSVFIVLFILLIILIFAFMKDFIKRTVVSTVLSMTMALRFIDISMAIHLRFYGFCLLLQRPHF